jgi:hypothetical protein
MQKYILAWFPMLIIAIANGMVRQSLYAPVVGDLAAHQISTVIAIVLFGLYIRWGIRRWAPASPSQAVAIGIVWFLMTVAFEFLFGRFVAGHPWETLIANYDLSAGRLWPLVLVWLAVAPWLFHRLRTRRAT